MKKLLLILVIAFGNKSSLAQPFTIKCDTVNFEYRGGPYIMSFNELLNETPTNNFLGLDNYQTVPLNEESSYFQVKLDIKKPVFVQLVNGEILGIPGKQVYGEINGLGQHLNVYDSNDVNHFFIELRKKTLSIRLLNSKDISQDKFLNLYDSMKTLIGNHLAYLSLPEIKKKYGVNNWAISYLEQYFMTELRNFLLSPTYMKKDYDMKVYKKYKDEIPIRYPQILLEFQQGRIFLQRHFFYYALPDNNYDLLKALNSDSLFKDPEIRKYLGFRYFSHLYADENALRKIKDFDRAYSNYKASYIFKADEKLALNTLEFRMRESRVTIQSLMLNEEISSNGSILTTSDKRELSSGNKILYFWASWCLPCREYLNGLGSNTFRYKGKEYTMIFISIDSDTNKWKKANYPFFSTSNNFLIGNRQNSKLLRTYQIGDLVPRALLLENGKLIESNLEKRHLKNY